MTKLTLTRAVVCLTGLLLFVPGVGAQQAVALPDGKAGVAYEHKIRTDGGMPPLTWRLTAGELPPGLKLEPDGTLRGVPAGPRREPYEFVVEVADSSEPPQRFAQPFKLRVQAAPLRIVAADSSAPLRIVPPQPGVESAGDGGPAVPAPPQVPAGQPAPAPAEKPDNKLEPPMIRPPQAGSKQVSGRGRPKAKIYLFVDNVPQGTDRVDNETGDFVVELEEPLAAGQEVTARQRVDGQDSPASAPVLVQPQLPPPLIAPAPEEGEEKVQGNASPGATVEIELDGAVSSQQARAESSGSFAVQLGRALRPEEKIKARQMMQGLSSPWSAAVAVTSDCPRGKWDCRERFEASAYIGFSVDTFAGSETLKYLNLDEAANDKKQRGIGGFDFAYRLTPEPGNRFSQGRGWISQLWVFGETVHGVRSADVDCTKNLTFPTCAPFSKQLENAAKAGDTLFFILRNATSLEAFGGLRYEFYSVGQETDYPANLYLKGQLGLAQVAHGPDDAADMHHIGGGLILTKSPYQGSYFDVGYGRSDVFGSRRRRRVKWDGFLSRQITKGISFFAQIFVDSDFGRGSDSVQSFFGFDFDLLKMKDWFTLPPPQAEKKKDETEPNKGAGEKGTEAKKPEKSTP